jgi:1-acyl-sn-glycerol-3-phosphate acyltransferase
MVFPLATAMARDGLSKPLWCSQVSPWLAPVAYGLGGKAVLPFYFQDIMVTGQQYIPKTGPVLLAPTHRSRWDSLLVAHIGKQTTGRYLRFMVTADECLGLQGWAIKKLGGFPVNGQRPAIATLRHGVELLQQQQMLVIFPEGNIYRSHAIQPLKPGLARLAVQAGQSQPGLNIQIVPISLQYNQSVPQRGSRVHINIGKPLHTSHYSEDTPLKAQAQALTQDLQQALTSLITPQSPKCLAGVA